MNTFKINKPHTATAMLEPQQNSNVTLCSLFLKIVGKYKYLSRELRFVTDLCRCVVTTSGSNQCTPVLAVSAKTKQIPQRHMGRKSDNEKTTTREEGFCHIMWARRLKEL